MYRFQTDNKLLTIKIFTQNDEPSLVNLGIPVDTQPTLLHPNTKEIMEKIEIEWPFELRKSRLAQICKSKLDSERIKIDFNKLLIKYRLFPFKENVKVF